MLASLTDVLPSTAPAPTNPRGHEGHKSPTFRPDIEGLRGIAVLLVVAFHAQISFWRGGFLGVDVFFVLSGYLITGLLLRDLEVNGKLDLIGFYARRARRLLPASALVVAFTVVTGALLLSPIEQARYSKTALATTLYVSNVWFTRQASSYFAPQNDTNPLLQTWSLAVEEQFYLVWPFLLWIGFRLFRSRRGLCKFLAVVSALSLAACIWLTRTNQPWAFFGSPTRAWEFGLGGIASLMPATLFANRRAKILTSWMSLAVLLGAAVLTPPGPAFPGVRALLPVLATATLLVAGAAGVPVGASRMLAHPVLQWFGRLSYSWYLWHWPLFTYAEVVFPGISSFGRALVAAVSLIAALLTHHTVENPIRFHRILVKRPRLTLCLAAVLSLFGVSICVSSNQLSKRDAMIPRQRKLQTVMDNRGTDLFREGCLSTFGDARLHECVFGDRHGSVTVALFGDSHAAHWFPALEQIALERKWKLVTFVKAACPSADVQAYNPLLGRVETECLEWRAVVLTQIIALHPDLIVISNSRGYLDIPKRHGAHGLISVAAWREGTRRTVAELNRAALRTVVLHDVPGARMDAPICLSRVLAHRWYPETWCRSPRAEQLDPEVLMAEQAAVSDLGNVRVVDFSNFFCDASTCKQDEQGEPIYIDKSHLNPTFARTLAPLLWEKLDPVLQINPAAAAASGDEIK
jgi:peptidoglycan/LPS O-acetylase OafA/YrhL